MQSGPKEESIQAKRSRVSKEFGFEVTESEWETARSFFEKNPNEVKLDRKNHPDLKLDHSFYYDKHSKDIVAIKAKHHYTQEVLEIDKGYSYDQIRNHPNLISHGARGKYRLGVSYKSGSLLGVKIEGAKNFEDSALANFKRENEANINKRVHGTGSISIRHFDVPKLFLAKPIAAKQVYFLKHIPGVTLQSWLNSDAALYVINRLKVVKNLCEAQMKLMDMGVIHNDIKTENIIVAEDLSVEFIDFGFSRMVKFEDIKENFTKTIPWCGSLLYTDPNFYAKSQCGFKSDAYSTTVIIGELIGLDANSEKIHANNSAYTISLYLDKQKSKLDPEEFPKHEKSIGDALFKYITGIRMTSKFFKKQGLYTESYGQIMSALLDPVPTKRPTLDKLIPEIDNILKMVSNLGANEKPKNKP